MRHRSFVSILIMVGLWMVVGRGWAQSESDLGAEVGEELPWAKGVSKAKQDKARAIFAEGNKLLAQQYFKEAAARYRDALQLWEHPAIYYNLSLALTNLEKPVEVYEALRKAVEYGAAPLANEATFQRAESQLKLLRQQLGHVEIVCEQEGIRVNMDGQLLFIGPGRYKAAALAGEHTIVASKKDFLTENRQVVLSAGKELEVVLHLFGVNELTYEKRRFATWIPWAVTGGGAAFLALGGLFHQQANGMYDEFDGAFDDRCPIGCAVASVPDLDEQLGQAKFRRQMEIAAYGIGGVAAATGLVLVFLNRPEIVRKEHSEADDALTVIPIFGSEMTGVRAGMRF